LPDEPTRLSMLDRTFEFAHTVLSSSRGHCDAYLAGNKALASDWRYFHIGEVKKVIRHNHIH
jgi:hypothetical protein